MKLAIKLAYRNLTGAGLRTWLNVMVLSFAFVVILWLRAVMTGWHHQARNDMVNYQIGAGQYWHEQYDPYDPFTLSESHAHLPAGLIEKVNNSEATPLLAIQGTIFPRGRMQSITIKGIDPHQDILRLPTRSLDTITDAIPAFIGAIMARNSALSKGDRVTLRWRDAAGTFDAGEIVITDIFYSDVPTAEAAQVYIPLEKLREMTSLPGHATILTLGSNNARGEDSGVWVFKSTEDLTRQLDEMIKTKNTGTSIMYGILLLLAMLAIFDTQVLSIFRRQKEIGTYIALGYTRRGVVWLFTTEGTMHAFLAFAAALVWGLPLLYWQARVGWTIPMDVSEFGLAMAQTLYPAFSLSIIFSTVLILTITTAVVSYLPSRKIAKMNPTEALRGKLQ